MHLTLFIIGWVSCSFYFWHFWQFSILWLVSQNTLMSVRRTAFVTIMFCCFRFSSSAPIKLFFTNHEKSRCQIYAVCASDVRIYFILTFTQVTVISFLYNFHYRSAVMTMTMTEVMIWLAVSPPMLMKCSKLPNKRWHLDKLCF